MIQSKGLRSLTTGLVFMSLFLTASTAHARAKIKTCADLDVAAINKKASNFEKAITKYSNQYRVDRSFVKAVIGVESCYRPRVRSSAGARGLMQLMPVTAKRFGVQNRNNPSQNIKGGVRYLRFLLDRYNGDKALAAAAYNAGEGNVDKYRGTPPFRETKRYVKEVFKLYRKLTPPIKVQQVLPFNIAPAP